MYFYDGKQPLLQSSVSRDPSESFYLLIWWKFLIIIIVKHCAA